MRLFRPRLRTVLLLINLLVLALPLGGFFVLRIYESALVRQTESELIAQGAFIAATYEALLARQGTHHDAHARAAASLPEDYGIPVTFTPPPDDSRGRWRLRNARLDLANDPVLPPPDDPQPAQQAGEPTALAVGRDLTPILRNAQLYTLSGMRVVDFHGVIVASTGEDLGRSLAAQDEVRRALTGEPVSAMRFRSGDEPQTALDSISRGSRIRVFVALPIERDARVVGAVLLARTPANIRQAMYGKRHALLRAGLLILAVVLALSLLTSLTISRPVYALIAQARRAARGETGAVSVLRRPGTREIAELSETVAAMAATLEARARYIRDFAAHVSHEFKTPLTAMRGAVELLRDHAATMSADERERFLNMLDADAERLERLVRRLLELARADMLQPGGEHCRLHAVIDAVAARYRALGLAVDTVGSYELDVAMPAETLDSILGTLLDNARQHAGASAQVVIESFPEAGGGSLLLTVRDDGPGISAGNAGRVFEPFFTTARERGGTGLGLSILRALLRAHGGDVALATSARGAAFRVQLPLAGDAP